MRPVYTLTPTGWHVLPTMDWLGGMLFLTVESAALGLLVYGLTCEGKPDKLAWEPLNPRGGSGERIDQTVCAGAGQRRYWVVSARGRLEG